MHLPLDTLPAHLRAMLECGLGVVQDDVSREELRSVSHAVAAATFDRWLSKRTADDNRVEHEFVVFGAAMRIGETERLPLDGMLAVICATFLHDTHPIQRITERMVREAAKRDPLLAAALIQRKAAQRTHHMQMGARNAGQLLRQLGIVSTLVRERCEAIIASHDCWKLGQPHPLSSDPEAVVCFEADALWPLHPLGVLADLERPEESGAARDVNDPAEWRRQVRNNLQTLREYRANWEATGECFQDAHTIFRTVEGYRLYREWAGMWGL
ncbi:MAG: hypothetical protein ABI806_27410 [Candidatus Solibacter sp.]